MHRFIEFRTIGAAPNSNLAVSGQGVQDIHARLALRADCAFWLLGVGSATFEVNRGAGWLATRRVQLCAGDRIRLGHEELGPEVLGALFGVEPRRAAGPPVTVIHAGSYSGPSLMPIFAPAEVMDRPRRNPDTGQIEKPQLDNGRIASSHNEKDRP
jgi:hypothetical protein